ncbi:MAG: PepSY-like domain-containing protein [Crocinitomicaceae bacterium]|nr:PepSY-like domain-containing protein [Crocinitomicaceae bacterium]MBK8927396.1 PepSY-like domain-containing protein [Crocinitomicaceae bacterium]
MKNLLFLTALILFGSLAYTQKIEESAVPDSVKSVFKLAYPEVTTAKWEKERNGDYEVNFRVNGNKNSVTYSPSGKVLETEFEIAVSELPKEALAYIEKNYAGQEITEAAKITSADGKIKYEAEIGGKDIFFDVDGKLIK